MNSLSSPRDHKTLPGPHAPTEVLFTIDLVGSKWVSPETDCSHQPAAGTILAWGSRLNVVHRDCGTGGLLPASARSSLWPGIAAGMSPCRRKGLSRV